ncbi:MAG: class I SAM-dependent DNA methyltransferase, partial [Proteobacteria bacterium]|nr:class I SAM-dependent DNA methyltransferase [Pseudomonadota bacterium]
TVARAAVALRERRRSLLAEHELSLRQLYRTLERPGDHPLKDAHASLDEAVRAAYGMGKRDQTLDFLFELNQELAKREEDSQAVGGPGLPACATDPAEFITDDCFPLPPSS